MVDRRGLLGASAALAVGGPWLAGCAPSSGGGGTEQQQENAAVTLPTYTKYEGVTPDFVGTDIVLDGFKAYPAEPVKAIEEPPGDGKVITLMTHTPGALPPGKEQNAFWQELDTRLGSPLDISLAPNDQYTAKFQARVASGDLPDVINIPNSTARLPDLLEATCMDLTEHLAGDAVADYPFLANLGPEYWKGCVAKGRIYTLPVPRLMSRTSGPLYRADLLAEKGINDPEPKDFEEFLALCQEVNEPKSNRWAWSRMPNSYVYQMLGIPNGWQEEGGAFTYWMEDERVAQGLEAQVKLLKAGVLNPDAFTAKSSTRKQWFGGGTVIFDYDSYVAWNQYYSENTAGEEFAVGMLDVAPFASGAEPVNWLGSALDSITGFNKDSEHSVETLLKVANWMAAGFGTQEYLFRKYGTEGANYELAGTDPTPTREGVIEVGLGIQYFTDAPMSLYYPGKPEVPETQHAIMTKQAEKLSRDASYGLYSETKVTSSSGPSGALNDTVNQIVQGKQPVSDYAPALKTWQQETGDAMRAEYEEAFAASEAGG
ncbi:extracellular solute-binding protein [Propionibacteriaceae bacterium Y2011]